MLLSLIIVFFLISLILIGIGFFLEDTNPYLILFGSIILLLVGMDIIVQGIEIQTGEISINATPEGNRTNTIINQETEVISNRRIEGFSLVVVLLSLYLSYYSIAEIIGRKYGRGTEEDLD